MAVSSIPAIEILDSRGRHILAASAWLGDGRRVRSGVRGGISTIRVAVGDSCRSQSSQAGASRIVSGTVARNLLRHRASPVATVSDFADNQ